MDIVQDCMSTLRHMTQQLRQTLQNEASAWKAAQEEVTMCGCGGDTCQLGEDGCKPQTHLITEKEIS